MASKLILRGDFVAYQPNMFIDKDKPIIGRVEEISTDEQLIIFTGNSFMVVSPVYCTKINHNFATEVELNDETSQA